MRGAFPRRCDAEDCLRYAILLRGFKAYCSHHYDVEVKAFR